MKNKIFISFLFFASLAGYAQKLNLIDSTAISSVNTVSVDRLGNFYIADKKGSIFKYSSKGELLLEFSPQKTGTIDLLEAWNPLRVFGFYRDYQEYVILDRFLTTSNRYSIRQFAEYAGLTTISLDNNLWLIDYENFALRKYNLTFQKFTLNTSFDLLLDPDNYDITFMKEYQNLLFIGDSASGILVFDNLGNYLKKIVARGINYFNFEGPHIYYLNENELTFVNIYNDTTSNIELKKGPQYILKSNDKVALVFNKYFLLYSLE